MLSTTHCYLKAVPLKTDSTVGTADRMFIPRTAKEPAFNCPSPAYGSTKCYVLWMSCSYNLTHPLFLNVPWEVSREFHQNTHGLFSGYLAAPKAVITIVTEANARKKDMLSYRHLKVTIFSIKGPMIQTTNLLSPLDWGLDHSRHKLISSCNLIEVTH